MRGTDASDCIHGLEGSDVLRGRTGDDRLVGGPGNDVLNGGPGHDTYVCGGGQDVVVIDSSRYAERISDGCEAMILDVSPHWGHTGSPRRTATDRPATPIRLSAAEKCRVTETPTHRIVVVGVEGAVRSVCASADSRPVVAGLDLTAGRPLRFRDAVLRPPVHLIAVFRRGAATVEGRDRRSAGNGGRRSGCRECESSRGQYRNESLFFMVPPIPAERCAVGRRGTLQAVPESTVKAEIAGSKPVGRAGRCRGARARRQKSALRGPGSSVGRARG
jgi:hypothetical protein